MDRIILRALFLVKILYEGKVGWIYYKYYYIALRWSDKQEYEILTTPAI